MTLLRLYLLRHGEPARRDIFYGQTDVELSRLGRAQARAQADALAPVELSAIYSSDLQRAWNGALLLAARAARPQPIAAPELREMHLGLLEEREYARALRDHPEHAGLRYEDMLDHRFPGGGESVRDVAARLLPFIALVIRAHAGPPDAAQSPPSVAIVAHNTVHRLLLAHAAGLGSAGYIRFPQELGAISRIDVERVTDAPEDPLAAAAITLSNWRPHLH